MDGAFFNFWDGMDNGKENTPGRCKVNPVAGIRNVLRQFENTIVRRDLKGVRGDIRALTTREKRA
ncbi:unnamed protein product [marine sediment metagenome]|uniref:Uncharacterized protein n=1 Tax=marine sediment metagenome TaxID=412755 RepID=X1F4L4_9ZZZZ